MKLSRIALGFAMLALVVPFAFACEPPPPPPPGHSPGYWKHNVRVYCRGIAHYNNEESTSTMEAYEAYIIANIDSGFTLCWADMVMWNNAFKSIWITVADYFNEAAGLGPYNG